MDILKTEVEALHIILIGSFNPAIYHPEWFSRMGLIREEEAKAPKIDVVHSEITSETIGNIRIQVQSNRFAAHTMNAGEYEVLRDLVIGTFKSLPHTPIRLMGINFEAHYKMSSVEAWHRLGDRLAPKGPWGDTLKQPGMISLTMEGQRPDNYTGYLRVKVEPSRQIKNGVGVFIAVNDHYEIPDHKPADGSGAIMEVLSSCWESSLNQSRSIAEFIARSS